MVGPTVHSLLIDVLLRFYLHYIVLTGDMSKKYSAVKLTIPDRDYYWFDWKSDYRTTHLTFGVSASSFAANMAVQQNALDHLGRYLLTATVAEKAFKFPDWHRNTRGSNSVANRASGAV